MERRSIRVSATAVIGSAVLAVVPAVPATATAGDIADLLPVPETSMVINEFAPSGPSGSADEFVELRNIRDSSVSLDGWSLSVCLGASSFQLVAFGPGTVVPPGGHLLVAHAGHSSPWPDVTYSSVDVPDDGGWRLGAPPGSRSDQVGIASFSLCTEGMPAPSCDWAAGQAVARDEHGTDTGDNAADFTCQARTPGW